MPEAGEASKKVQLKSFISKLKILLLPSKTLPLLLAELLRIAEEKARITLEPMLNTTKEIRIAKKEQERNNHLLFVIMFNINLINLENFPLLFTKFDVK